MSEPSEVDALKQQILDNQKVIDDLNRNLSRKTQEVRIIQEISSEINSTINLDEILSIILHSMDSVFGFTHSMILLLDEGEERLRVAASRGYEQSGVGAEVQIGQGVIGVVAKKRKLMRMGNIGTQLNYFAAVRTKMHEAGTLGLEEAPKLPGLPNVQSQVAIPLLIKERLIGVFAVESSQASVFDERDEVLITILANQAASAIHKARLYRSEEDRRKDLDRANDELQRLNETLEERVRERTEDLRKAQAQLVQSEKMASLGMLVAGIAHEINTPVGALHSMHDTVFRAIEKLKALVEKELESGIPVRTRAEAIFAILGDSRKVIESGTERVTTIVKRLRSFARLDEADLKEADIHEGLEDTLSLIRHELKDIKVTKAFGAVPRITCFPGRLNQVFLNILMNARQALRERGEITIATEQRGDEVRIVFTDNGVGIAPTDLKRVFDPGFTTKGVGVGTGLGLSICYQIIQDHKGDIRIESELGRGTSVIVTLPRDRSRVG